jgi:flagellar protein FliO/FliZ
LGGEKLKPFLPYKGVLVIVLIFYICFFGIIPNLTAQEITEKSPETEAIQGPVNESEIILGETPAVPVSYNGSSVFVMLRMILVLALAALAIYGVVFFIKRLARPQESRDPHLKILARVPLGNDSFAAVISLGPKAWLVGGGSGGLNIISEVEDTETLETLLLDDARRNAEAGTKGLLDFRSLLGRFGKNQAGRSSHTDSVSLAESLRKQRERLKGL